MSGRTAKSYNPPKKRGPKPKKTVAIVQEIAPAAVASKPIPKKIKNYVKGAIDREIEVNQSQKNIWSLASTLGAGCNFPTDTRGLTSTSIIPTVVKGDEVNQRDGNRIRVKKFILRYALRAMDVTNGGTNDNPFSPFMVRVCVYSHKYNKSDSSNEKLLKTGATAGPLGITPESWFEDYYKDEFNIHHSKTYYMQPARRATGNLAPNQYAQDSTVPKAKQYIQKSVSIKVPKTFLYNDVTTGTLANLPTNCNMFMLVAVCNVSGTMNNATTDQRCQVSADTFLNFTDA